MDKDEIKRLKDATFERSLNPVEVKVRKVGGSYVISLPSPIVKLSELDLGGSVIMMALGIGCILIVEKSGRNIEKVREIRNMLLDKEDS